MNLRQFQRSLRETLVDTIIAADAAKSPTLRGSESSGESSW
jgi:hypothetical protein